MKQTMTALAFGLSLAAVLPAAAQDNNFWGSVGNWDISIDPTIDNGCYTLAEWNGGTIVRLGNNPQLDNFYFLIGNPAWSSLQPDGEYEIQIQFGNRPVWDVSAIGFQFNPGETVYLHAQSTQRDFIEEFQAAVNMRISYQGQEIDNLKLNGSRRAWDEVMRCQAAMNARGGPTNDPFATSDDPFASGGQGKNSATKKKK